MIQQLDHRLVELQAEWQAGQKMMADLDARQSELRATLLRISGAIQILEEVIADERVRSGTGVLDDARVPLAAPA